jgi:hypothetical protein
MWLFELVGLTALVGIFLGIGLRVFDIIVENIQKKKELKDKQ